ncbi:hypothetical protein OUZ56_021641 [Daphnia magna]|uniref:CxC3 like cysteine cluster domain-containing protein n=1 Tax=Daphnia magna TaxID=35525 RepID=A0ABR0AUK6_9CRUS|nr:hypothetical protein OUZ56_021641 [Daphnia magna]
MPHLLMGGCVLQMDVLIPFLTIIFAVMIVNVTSAIAAINPFIFGYRSINEYGLIRKALRGSSTTFQKYQSSSLLIAAGNDFCIVITANGRFDLSTALFRCNSCECTFDATLDDCFLSGFWPPVPNKFTFLCCSQLLTLWHHLKLLTPGTSEQKFLETISAIVPQLKLLCLPELARLMSLPDT